MHNAHEVDVGCVDVLLGQVTLRKLLSCAVYVHIHTLLLLWTCVLCTYTVFCSTHRVLYHYVYTSEHIRCICLYVYVHTYTLYTRAHVAKYAHVLVRAYLITCTYMHSLCTDIHATRRTYIHINIPAYRHTFVRAFVLVCQLRGDTCGGKPLRVKSGMQQFNFSEGLISVQLFRFRA